MFRASSAHLQEDIVVRMQHMVLSLSMRVPGGLSVHSLSDGLMTAFKHDLVVLESCHQTCMTYTSAECTVENS